MEICIAVCAALACTGLALVYLYVGKKCKLSGGEWLIAAAACAAAAFAVFRLEQKGTDVTGMIKILWVLTLMLAAGWVDAREKIVPNQLILLGLAGRCLIYIAEFLSDPSGFGMLVLRDLAGTGITLAALLLIVFISRSAMGFGDVKLLGVVSLFCGLSWTYSCFLYGLIAAALASVYLLAVKKAGRKYQIAFAPYLLAGYLITAVL